MKRIKMALYGEPGVGKSVFASQAPKPFFITTDGNYEWLEDFGAKEEDHVQVNSWEEAKVAFKRDFSNYETIVIDLTEDLFKWCEQEFCIKNRIEHVSDIGYGKGYDISRNEFFLEMCKLIGLDKHIIFIMHGYTTTVKDRRGVEHTKYVPSNRLPDKVLDMLEGRVRYFLRCYLKAEETEDNVLIKKRYLSLIPKENEFGICRGINENSVPHDIPLDFKIFANIIGIDVTMMDSNKKSVHETIKKEIPNIQNELKNIDSNAIKGGLNAQTNDINKNDHIEKVEENKEEKIVEKVVEKAEDSSEKTNKVSTENSKKELTNEEKLANIRAKLAEMKANKK